MQSPRLYTFVVVDIVDVVLDDLDVATKNMPTYKTFYNSVEVGVYSGQRPSTAACKAFTQLRKAKPTNEAIIDVLSTTKKKPIQFRVEYKESTDDLLGTIYRPYATKIDHENAAAAAAAAAAISSSEYCGQAYEPAPAGAAAAAAAAPAPPNAMLDAKEPNEARAPDEPVDVKNKK